MTFNIRHGRGTDGLVDLDRVVAACRDARADVLALQELDRDVARSGGVDQCSAIAAALGMEGHFGQAVPLGGGGYGVGLLVRGAIDAVEVTALPSVAGAEHRVVLVAEVQVGEARVSVAVTHLANRRPQALAQLPAALAQLVRRPRPWLLLGDLNLAPRQARPAIERAGLRLARVPPAFPSALPWRRIDHAAMAGLRASGAAAPPTRASDHRPVVVDLVPG